MENQGQRTEVRGKEGTGRPDSFGHGLSPISQSNPR